MLYLAIPAHNEVATIGVLLWRLRTVLAEFPREYEVVVYDDASDDETADVAEQYAHAMPVSVLRGKTSVGYAGAVDILARHIAGLTRYPRRDAMLLLQGDFTDPPGIVPEFARRFEGGADLVVGERTAVVDAPVPVRRLFTAAGWALRPFVRVSGVRDLTGSMRLIRISALRDLLRTAGDAPVCSGDSWTANADLLLRLMPHARRVETVPLEPTYGVRTRDTRRVTVRDALAALRWGWRSRGRHAEPSSTPESNTESAPRGARGAGQRRRDEPEVTVDKLRERSKDRERLRGDSDAAPPRSRRDTRPERDRSASRSTEGRGGESARAESSRAESSRDDSRREDSRRPDERSERKDAPKNARRDESKRDESKRDEARPPRDASRAAGGRNPSAPPRARPAPVESDDSLLLDDPFAGRSPRRPTDTPLPTPVAEYVVPNVPGGTIPPVQPPSGPPASRAADRVDDDTEADDADDETLADDAAADASMDESADASTPDARERKRRRNRRSRRRRSKNRPPAAEGEAAENGDAIEREPVAERGGDEPDDREADGDDEGEGDVDDASSDAGTADDSSAASNARAKRRGRRGRRGGSRRSRGRGREGGDGSNDNSTGGAGDGPSSGPADGSSSDSVS